MDENPKSAAARISGGPESSGPEWRGHVALTAVQVFFGLFPVFAIWTTSENAWTPYAIAVYRIVFGAVVLGAIAVALHGRRVFPSRRDFVVLCVGSVLGVTLNQVLFLNGVAQSTSVNAGLVMCLIPVFTFAIAALVRQESFAMRRAIGVLVALSGTAFWFVFEKEANVAAHGRGNLLMIANALSYSIFLVLSKPLLKRIPPIVVIAWIYVLALPFVPWLLQGVSLKPVESTNAAWLALAWVLIFPTALAYLLNTYALSKLRASTIAVYIYMQPFIAALGGMVLLDEKPSAAVLGMAAFVFTGIFLVVWGRRPAPLPAKA